MPRCGFFWLISYDGFCDDSQNPNNNVSCLVWRLQRGCSGVHGCLVPFDILNASRCIISSCWWFHPWFRCGVLWLWLILNMLRHGFHSRANWNEYNLNPLTRIHWRATRSWTLGWVDRSASGVHRLPRPFCRRCAPGLNWPGRASGAVTLKKLECSKQAYALDTLAWDNTTGF
ncbi:hypothetical protein VNO77_48658 [Canavalia gladiata]|uniref:Uncharacterized protein n=1 Tax=Canavalia gladiata TaxID=3824 RepID=A0AAN9PG62_CANGL